MSDTMIICKDCGAAFEPDGPGRWKHYCFGSTKTYPLVTAAVGGPIISGEMALVVEPEPWLETIVPGYSRSVPCNGPGCRKEYDGTLWPPKSWLRVGNRDGQLGEFCSNRCLANWLASELAKEETDAARHATKPD